MDKLNIVVISDSSGGTAFCDAKTTMSQFPNITAEYKRFPFIKTLSILKSPLNYAKKYNAVIFDTIVSPQLNEKVYQFAKWNHLVLVDCLHQPVSAIKNKYHVMPVLKTGMVHRLTPEYFDRISAVGFTSANDDGKHPENIPKADIIILGPSRTSKTPLSLYLAQHYGFKVINIPIGPTTQLPKELRQVKNKHIFGLLNSVSLLQKIRSTRMVRMGLPKHTKYSDPKCIQKELDYAKNLYKSLNCLPINVANKSIEETSAIMLQAMGLTKM